jgi:hypothetical protein
VNARIRRSRAYRETRLAAALGRALLGVAVGLFLWPALWMFMFCAYDVIGDAYGVDMDGMINSLTDEVFFSPLPFVLFLAFCAGLGATAGTPFFRWMAGWNDRFGSHGPGQPGWDSF